MSAHVEHERVCKEVGSQIETAVHTLAAPVAVAAAARPGVARNPLAG